MFQFPERLGGVVIREFSGLTLGMGHVDPGTIFPQSQFGFRAGSRLLQILQATGCG